MQSALTTSIMRPYNAPRQRRHTRVENHPSPSPPFHVRQTQLRQQNRAPAIDPPRPLENFHIHLLQVRDVAHPAIAARIGEEDVHAAELLGDVGVQLADAGESGEVGLEEGDVDGVGDGVVDGVEQVLLRGDRGRVVLQGEVVGAGAGEGDAGGEADACGIRKVNGRVPF